MVLFNRQHFERFTIAPPELTTGQVDSLINVANLASYQLDWLAEQLGLTGDLYWDDLELTIFEKRIILQNAISADPEWRWPLNLEYSPFGKYRFFECFSGNSGIVIDDRVLPDIHLYGGITYSFNLNSLFNLLFSQTLNQENPILADDSSEILYIVDRTCEGFLLVTVPLTTDQVIRTTYYTTDEDGDRVGNFGFLHIHPWRNTTDWMSNRKPVLKNVKPDEEDNNGELWIPAKVENDIPVYPDFNRTEAPPLGYYYVDDRPTLVMREDSYYDSQVFRYDNDYFLDQNIPEMIYRPDRFYDWWGVHGGKGSLSSLYFMFDTLNMCGFNDKVLILEQSQSVPDNFTGSYVEGREYVKGETFVYSHLDHSEPLTDIPLDSWYVVKHDYTADNITFDLRDGYLTPLILSPRKTLYKMVKDSQNEIIPLRVWLAKDLQVSDDVAEDYDNPIVADYGYVNNSPVATYFIRLPLELERGGKEWSRVKLLCESYTYYGELDYSIGFAYFAADFSAADEAIFDPGQDPNKFNPRDSRKSNYIKQGV